MLTRFKSLRFPLAIATLGIAGVVGSASLANDRTGASGHWRDHGGWRMLLPMDADKDGAVTRAEIEAFEAARAAEIDSDKDGTVTADEMEAYREKMRAQRMAERLARMDRDGDGVVSVEEYEEARTWRLARFDRDGDGTIERHELVRHGAMHPTR